MLEPSINTLGMPEWSLEQFARFALDQQVPYIEVRGLKNSLDLLHMPDLNDPQRVSHLRALLLETGARVLSFNLGLRIVDFNEAMAKDIRAYASLAQRFDAPYLRFFAGGNPNSDEAMRALIVKANRVADILAGYPVVGLVETHDTLIHSKDVFALIQGTGERLGVLWDAGNTLSQSEESWQETYETLQPFIRYLHIKDGIRKDGEVQYTYLFEGELPMRELLVFLKDQPHPAVVSFEWEKQWHPELPPGDLATIDFLEKIRSLKT